jgi:hypothetical protein
MLSSLLFDLVVFEVECGKCLCEMIRGEMCNDDKKEDGYSISPENFSNILNSLLSDLIVFEIECGKCLCEMRQGGVCDEDKLRKYE